MDYLLSSPEQLKSFIKGSRKKVGLTQEKLADMLGITQQAYQRIEASPEKASVERIMQIFKLIKVELVIRDIALETVATQSLTNTKSRAHSGYSQTVKPDPVKVNRSTGVVRQPPPGGANKSRKQQRDEIVVLVKSTGKKVNW